MVYAYIVFLTTIRNKQVLNEYGRMTIKGHDSKRKGPYKGSNTTIEKTKLARFLTADLRGATFANNRCTQLAYAIHSTRIVSCKSSLKPLHATQKKLWDFETRFKVVCNFDIFATKLPEWGGLWYMFFATWQRRRRRTQRRPYLIQNK